MLSGFRNPAVQSTHSTPAAARKDAELPVLLPIQRETRQRKLKVRGIATINLNSF